MYVRARCRNFVYAIIRVEMNRISIERITGAHREIKYSWFINSLISAQRSPPTPASMGLLQFIAGDEEEKKYSTHKRQRVSCSLRQREKKRR